MMQKATTQTPSPVRPVTAATPARATLVCKRLLFRSMNNREGEAATFRAHQPPTTQHQHHTAPAAGAAVPGQNTGGAVKKGQAASADQDSLSVQDSAGIESDTGPSQEVWGFLGIYQAVKLWEWASSSDFHLGVI
eukprot:scaffold101914_cov19-Tisochrysis_lutea.AAC.1